MAEKLRTRDQIEEKYKWKLTDIYPSDDAWEKAYAAASEHAGAFSAYNGKTAEDPKKIIREYESVIEEIMPIFEYAFLRKETDNADPVAQGLKDRAIRLWVTFSAVSSFIEPELLAMDESVLEGLMHDPDMADHDEYFRQLLRRKPHTLPKEQEQLIASMGEIFGAPDNIFTSLTEADMKLPPVIDKDGTELELSEGNYSTFIHSEDRDLRRQAFMNLMTTYGNFGNTIAGTYAASVKTDCLRAQTYHYTSARAATMEPLEIPESVYDNLISVIHEYLPVLHDYLGLRKKLLGLDELHMYDLYCPMLSGFKMDLPYDKAFDLVLEGLRPMGEDYLDKLREARDSGWIDVYPSVGKSSGAFSSGSLAKVHPYVLLNHNDNLDSAFTIAHELGHSMHSYYSNQTQPMVKADYSLFVAEVASTCNEAVMMRHLLSTFTEKDAQAFLLYHFLEQFRTTCFRQTMFAEFEKISHEMAERGEPLTKESLSKVYYGLNKDYYGATCTVDEVIANEWMRIPHFYRAFYVYVYATGLCAAVSLSEKILNEGAPAVEAYRRFLSAGCSVPPIEALKLAGIDMSSPEPVRAAMEVFKETVRKMHEVTGV